MSKNLMKGILMGASLIGGVGTIGLTMFDMGDTAKDLKKLVETSKDVNEVPVIDIEEA